MFSKGVSVFNFKSCFSGGKGKGSGHGKTRKNEINSNLFKLKNRFLQTPIQYFYASKI